MPYYNYEKIFLFFKKIVTQKNILMIKAKYQDVLKNQFQKIIFKTISLNKNLL